MIRSPESPRALVRYAIIVTAFVVCGLAVLWAVSDALLLIFAGVLFAAFLDGTTGLLGKAVSWPRGVRLATVSTLLAIVLVSAIAWGSTVIATQGSELATTIVDQVNRVIAWLGERGIELPVDSIGTETKQDTPPNDLGATPALQSVLKDFGGMFGPAWAAIAMVLGLLGDAIIIIVLGLFLAAQPMTYRDALLLLVPPARREHFGKVLDESGETLRHWLLGQLLTMVLIGLFVWLGLTLVGVEPALVLGLQAGLLAFIPTLGPLLAGIAIMLASLTFGLWAVIGALSVYLLIQALESYLLTPLIQKRAISVPPAFLFSSQIVLGLLFGMYGLVLATPLAAVARVFTARLYVERLERMPDPHEDA